MTLTNFLLARIAEDEAVAHGSAPAPWLVDDAKLQTAVSTALGPRFIRVSEVATAAHIACFDPARVLAECEAKRRIVEALTLPNTLIEPTAIRVAEIARRVVLGNLALPYADHPDYRGEWKS